VLIFLNMGSDTNKAILRVFHFLGIISKNLKNAIYLMTVISVFVTCVTLIFYLSSFEAQIPIDFSVVFSSLIVSIYLLFFVVSFFLVLLIPSIFVVFNKIKFRSIFNEKKTQNRSKEVLLFIPLIINYLVIYLLLPTSNNWTYNCIVSIFILPITTVLTVVFINPGVIRKQDNRMIVPLIKRHFIPILLLNLTGVISFVFLKYFYEAYELNRLSINLYFGIGILYLVSINSQTIYAINSKDIRHFVPVVLVLLSVFYINEIRVQYLTKTALNITGFIKLNHVYKVVKGDADKYLEKDRYIDFQRSRVQDGFYWMKPVDVVFDDRVNKVYFKLVSESDSKIESMNRELFF